MSEASLYRTNASFSPPFPAVQHAHQRTDTCFVRFQAVTPVSVESGLEAPSSPNHLPFHPPMMYIMPLHQKM